MVNTLINDLLLSLNALKGLNKINGCTERGTEINDCIAINLPRMKEIYAVDLACVAAESVPIETGNTIENIDHDCSNNTDNFSTDSEKFKWQQKNDALLN